MHQLRWHPLLEEWVVFNTDRQNRPQMPANWCPFDPGSGRVPDNYDVYLYPNDFPGFSPTAPPFDPKDGLFGTAGPRGACDVVLYSPDHTLPPSKLTVENWRKVIDVWTEKTSEYIANPDIQLVCVFENSGEAVGVTMPHPHGQIYAIPFIAPNVRRELAATAKFARENGGACLFCRVLEEEMKSRVRLVAANAHFVAFVPYAARFPAEIGLYARRHVHALPDLTEQERDALAAILSVVRRKYDNLYGFLLPLMMAVKQAPAREPDALYHLHIQFLPLQRSPTKLKYLATMETAYGAFLADTAPEDMAAQLRKCEPVSNEESLE
ncbi:MAG TPA: galactose-1-phosphate uridylyltransferase [Bryobacteraceae bacterium]|jgi:UDPglucose--hexose-1-phosphate uridylyltransferase|nr:galactose-1-phosphate uridylyltransferase [Bryobacteraceae bacterium]